MADRTNRSAIKALLKAAAASLLCLSAFAPLLAPPLCAGEALNALNRIAAPAEPPAVPAVQAPAEPPLPLSAARPLKVYFISVGQGDSEYLELPNGKNALIDGGPSKASDSQLARFLSRHSVTKIDYVVLSHPHSDHYTGLYYVFSSFTVGKFYDTRMDNTSSTTDNTLRDKINSLGVNVTYPAPGDTLDWDPAVQVKVFNSCPDAVQSPDGQDSNDCSIVLKLAYKQQSVLFSGDVQTEVEEKMASRYGAELKADALKVGHHGSLYSSSGVYLQAVRPRDAYVSVGKNSYGHPVPAVLEKIKSYGAAVHRTDTDGTQELALTGVAAEALDLAQAR